MTQLDRFHSTLPFDTATNRLKNVRIQGVDITVKPIGDDTVEFRLDLRKRSPFGIPLTIAHLNGTLRRGKDGNTQITYQTHPLSRYSVMIITSIAIMITGLLIFILSPELAPIASVPGIAGVLFALFWNLLNSDVRAGDRFRLEELLERILEKQSSMATWEA